MKFFRIIALLLACVMSVPAPAVAQQQEEEAQADNNQAKIRVLPPAYDPEMTRLAEVLGSLHYLRELCGANEGQLWREQMQEMIKQEEPTDERRARLIASFNHGFRGFRETYRECTPAAVEASNRYLLEGARLSADIPLRYGR